MNGSLSDMSTRKLSVDLLTASKLIGVSIHGMSESQGLSTVNQAPTNSTPPIFASVSGGKSDRLYQNKK